MAPTQQSQGGASTSRAHHAGSSSRADLLSTPQNQGIEIPSTSASPSQAWPHGLSSPGFQQLMQEILLPGDDEAFIAHGGTPPSAHVPGTSWEIPFMAPAHVSTPPVSPAPAKQPNKPATRGRARKVPHRRGCRTGGLMLKISASAPNRSSNTTVKWVSFP
ncbi:hypothetical protein PIB30_043891 [Stylosanthes scabra]|uniref:Uncharacterized protein n=1 Tax=Stylosanthes scabra TaxID=79078 RepID=A0ABU6TFA6_9FABA|nr:hypothetical protein [Stylosanthes scabra]